MIKLLYNIIFIFLYYLLCICIYILYNNRKNKNIYLKSQSLKMNIKNIVKIEIENLKNGNEIEQSNLDLITNKIKSRRYQKEAIKVLLNYKNREDMIDFINKTNLLQPVLTKKDKDEYDKSYKIYLIGEFKNEDYYKYLVNSCDDESVFVQINALKALAKLGNEKYFLEGLLLTMKSSSLVHDKVISDNIYSISMRNNTINKLLKAELKDANDDLKKIIINQFLSTRFNDGKEIILKLLKDENTQPEVKMACIKYFTVIKYEKIENTLIQLLKDDIWEVRALTATALKNYASTDAISKLKESIKDPVWYVRQNSARSLCKIVKNKDELDNIVNGDDKYAADAIKSIMFELDKKEAHKVDFEFIQKRKVAYSLNETFEEENIDEGQLVGSL